MGSRTACTIIAQSHSQRQNNILVGMWKYTLDTYRTCAATSSEKSTWIPSPHSRVTNVFVVRTGANDLDLLMCLWCGRERRIWISTAMLSVIDSSCFRSTILTAYSLPLSLHTHLLTVLERPLCGRKGDKGCGGGVFWYRDERDKRKGHTTETTRCVYTYNIDSYEHIVSLACF